ncbi:hypothetical protein CFC21_033559 [Triticum aestivum]|uniref:RING-type E3 ubiquitin transferase n=3 Tax=Triticum aestivum TaxID=4565 RepID=A0A9R1F1S4_WHEAT|nr:hypothetical protein CFC21_033559 [Triticum aestivum]
MGTDVFDCPICSTPLSPPIFQCSLGHFVCSACHDKLPGTDRACSMCSRPVLDRCHGVECIVGSVLLPCSYALHGCTAAILYHQKGEHEKVCLHAPCFCPENGSGFASTTEALLGRFTAKHDWPITAFKYYEPFDVPVKADVHILHGSGEEVEKDNDSDLFLLHIGYPDAPLHSVSLVRVQAHAQEYGVGCSVGFSWFMGQYQVATLDFIRTSSLSNGLPKCSFCIVPEVRRGGGGPVMLSVTIGINTEEDEEDDNKEGDDDDSHVKVGENKEEDEASHKAD